MKVGSRLREDGFENRKMTLKPRAQHLGFYHSRFIDLNDVHRRQFKAPAEIAGLAEAGDVYVVSQAHGQVLVLAPYDGMDGVAHAVTCPERQGDFFFRIEQVVGQPLQDDLVVARHGLVQEGGGDGETRLHLDVELAMYGIAGGHLRITSGTAGVRIWVRVGSAAARISQTITRLVEVAHGKAKAKVHLFVQTAGQYRAGIDTRIADAHIVGGVGEQLFAEVVDVGAIFAKPVLEPQAIGIDAPVATRILTAHGKHRRAFFVQRQVVGSAQTERRVGHFPLAHLVAEKRDAGANPVPFAETRDDGGVHPGRRGSELFVFYPGVVDDAPVLVAVNTAQTERPLKLAAQSGVEANGVHIELGKVDVLRLEKFAEQEGEKEAE